MSEGSSGGRAPRRHTADAIDYKTHGEGLDTIGERPLE